MERRFANWFGRVRAASAGMVLSSAIVGVLAVGGCGGSPGTTRASRPNTSHSLETPARLLGRRACAGATPIEVARRYELPAEGAGFGKELAAYIANPPASTKSSTGFPRLVAALYASTVSAAQRSAAAAGCAEELASSFGG
jgi:hypothetical protein